MICQSWHNLKKYKIYPLNSNNKYKLNTKIVFAKIRYYGYS
jgi:hypothetical protein